MSGKKVLRGTLNLRTVFIFNLSSVDVAFLMNIVIKQSDRFKCDENVVYLENMYQN